MSVETILSSTMSEVPKSVAAGVVDMGTGMLLGVKTVDQHPSEVLDLVAAACTATATPIVRDEILAKLHLGAETPQIVRGFARPNLRLRAVVSTNLVHVFARLKSASSAVVVVVCRADTNLGLALMKVRAICSSQTL